VAAADDHAIGAALECLMMKSGLTRLLQGSLMTRTLGSIFKRLVPARSAPV